MTPITAIGKIENISIKLQMNFKSYSEKLNAKLIGQNH